MRFKRQNNRQSSLYRERNKLVSFLFKWMLILSYPVRKPLIFFPLLVILFLAPTFAGVKPLEVHLWYWNKIKTGVSFVIGEIESLWQKADINVDFKMPFDEKGTDRLVDSTDNRAGRSLRKAFGQSGKTPQGVDVMQQVQADDVVVPVFEKDISEDEPVSSATVTFAHGTKAGAAISVAGSELPLQKKADDSYRRDIKGLIYLDHPQQVQGNITVYDANTIDVGGTLIILFGVYSDPKGASGAAGSGYLRRTYGGKNAECRIVAYTTEHVATAICYVDKVNINKQMVIKGYSLDVAL